MTDFKWRHFQGDVILWAVRWYCRYPISYRDLEEMLAERGISVDHTTIYRWVQCYALMNPLMILVKIIKLRWIHILSYDQMVSRK
ncbi:hypothetical protein Q4S24_19495, partial [Morganella morganii]